MQLFLTLPSGRVRSISIPVAGTGADCSLAVHDVVARKLEECEGLPSDMMRIRLAFGKDFATGHVTLDLEGGARGKKKAARKAASEAAATAMAAAAGGASASGKKSKAKKLSKFKVLCSDDEFSGRTYNAGTAMQAARKAWRDNKYLTYFVLREVGTGNEHEFDASDMSFSVKKPHLKARNAERRAQKEWE